MKIENIKFKAKRLDNGKWVYGYYYEENSNTYIIENRQKESMLNRNVTYEVDPSTVCMFTGLKDENGVEVYANDIVRVEYGEEHIYNVEYDDYRFNLYNEYITFFIFCHSYFSLSNLLPTTLIHLVNKE